ncbi:MAG: hypothetical protein ACRD6N_07955, partial [Pyrinomonadaceae bacterium]
MAEDTSPSGGILGFFLGMVIAAGVYIAVMLLIGADLMTALIVAGVAAVVGAAYGAIALSKKVLRVGFFGIVGFILDMSWSLLNTLAGLLVWIPACKIAGANFVGPNDDSRRSGTFVYDANPRGGVYGATTIGTVIAGGWSSHEEIHVWQARIFGPLYMPAYIIALLLNIPFRLITTKTQDLVFEAYHRIPFEDWAYWAGEDSGSDINWGGWFLGFLLALVYTGAMISIPIGIV